MRVREASRPYAMPDQGVVVADRWMLPDGTDLPNRLDDWDPATDLHVIQEVEIDVDRLRDSTGLDAEAEVLLMATIRSDLTGLRVAGNRVPVSLKGRDSVGHAISLHVRGSVLGGTVTISTILVWMSGLKGGGITPKLAGSELWREETRCVLEGESSRFPVSAVAFSTVPTLEPAAAWTLDWEPSRLDEPVLGAVRLLVNTDYTRVRDSVISGSAEPGADVVRATVHFEVARTLIVGALAEEEFLFGFDSFPEGSVGRAIADLIRQHWDESPISLAARWRDFPRQFEMELQARFPPVPTPT
jgi:hypothetical protein